jgi:Flp pilus assembly protein TadD
MSSSLPVRAIMFLQSPGIAAALRPVHSLYLAMPLLSALLCGCAAAPGRDAADLAPLQLAHSSLGLEAVEREVVTPDLLAVDDEMRAFVERYTSGMSNRRQRLKALHRSVKGAGVLGIDYDPAAEGTAIETFHRGTANCLSYASLFIALAREADLNAAYQFLEVRPQWTRLGERVAVRLHVNVALRLSPTEQFMVDIDPLPSRDIAGSREISDTDAQALHHNNVAMEALARGDLRNAWLHEVRALQLSPDMAHLWVNMGAIYRHAGQHREAENNYLHALQLDPTDRSAMTNLVVLYRLEGRQEELDYWLAQVERYRDDNPYYHAWLGDQAGEAADWRAALGHYLTAVELGPEDAQLLHSTSLIYQQLDEDRAARHYLELAVQAATLQSERERYQRQLDALQGGILAGS